MKISKNIHIYIWLCVLVALTLVSIYITIKDNNEKIPLRERGELINGYIVEKYRRKGSQYIYKYEFKVDSNSLKYYGILKADFFGARNAVGDRIKILYLPEKPSVNCYIADTFIEIPFTPFRY